MKLPRQHQPILFQHLPKTGGISLVHAVEGAFYAQNWATAICYNLKDRLDLKDDKEWLLRAIYQFLIDYPRNISLISDNEKAREAAAYSLEVNEDLGASMASADFNFLNPEGKPFIGKEIIHPDWFEGPMRASQLQWTEDLFENVGLPRRLGSLHDAADGQELAFIVSSHHFLKDHRPNLPAFFYDNVHKFCVARNPYDRFVSAYYYFMNRVEPYTGSTLDAQVDGLKHDPFEKSNRVHREVLVNTYNSNIKDFIHNCPNYCEAGFHFMPQALFFLDEDNSTLLMDTILKYENLDSEWAAFCKSHLLIDAPLPKINATRTRPNWQEILDAEDRHKLSQFYWQDFEKLSYEK